MQHYTGIGSRKTPPEILRIMEALAETLALKGWTLRSGGARGADQAFEAGARKAGGGVESWDPRKDCIDILSWAEDVVAQHCWEFPYSRMKRTTKELLVRNMYQIHGEEGNLPSSFVVCYTLADPLSRDRETGFKSGGTRYAIREAASCGIEVFNLNNPEHLERIKGYIDKEKPAPRQLHLRKTSEYYHWMEEDGKGNGGYEELRHHPKTEVVNLRNDDYTVYIGRPKYGEEGKGEWGNPIVRGRQCPLCSQTHPDAGSTLPCYRKYLWGLLKDPKTLSRFLELRGQILGCFCKPGPCHGDIMKELLDYEKFHDEQEFLEVLLRER